MDASQGYTKTTVHMFNYTRQYCDIYKLEHFYITEKIITHNCFLFLTLIRIIYQRNYTITQTLTHKNARARAHARTHTHTHTLTHTYTYSHTHTHTHNNNNNNTHFACAHTQAHARTFMDNLCQK